MPGVLDSVLALDCVLVFDGVGALGGVLALDMFALEMLVFEVMLAIAFEFALAGVLTLDGTGMLVLDCILALGGVLSLDGA